MVGFRKIFGREFQTADTDRNVCFHRPSVFAYLLVASRLCQSFLRSFLFGLVR